MSVNDDVKVFRAEANRPVTWSEARVVLITLRGYARQLHGIYERQCNGHQTPFGDWDEDAFVHDAAVESSIEQRVRAIFDSYGLGLYLNTDPRGNPIGILTPKTGRYNTMGGREDGWRL